MIYKIEDNKIIVFDKTQFNPKHILECGQVFRFGKDENNHYFVISKDKKATIIETENNYQILSSDPEYFVEYFDLNTDYNKIKNQLQTHKIISEMIPYGYGIRILKGDPHEMIFSYIISQNNNIKRIQKIIESLCKIGSLTNEGFYAFPTISQLSSKPLEFYQTLSAGYRDKFLKQTADYLSNINLEEIKSKTTDEIYDFLISLQGVGPKVASCILLFGFHKMDKFPVDTWLEQVYYNHFSNNKLSRPDIQKYFESIFKENSGIAQQYMFYYERERKN